MSDGVNLPVPEGDSATVDKSFTPDGFAGADKPAAENAESNSVAGAANSDARERAKHGRNHASRGGTSGSERRSRRRALISAPVRVRSLEFPEGIAGEVSTTLDVSRGGFLYVSSLPQFAAGMPVQVTFPYTKAHDEVQAEQAGRVVRVTEMPDGRRAVAIAIGIVSKGELVDPGLRVIEEKPTVAPLLPTIVTKIPDRPVILVVDSDESVRDTLKLFLTDEGYEAIAVPNAAEAHVVLSLYTPALVVAEIEGEDLPGYDLCARIKTTPRLQTIPVVLMTRSAYPSDYANAHSLGAMVCMAKPFRMERFAHVVKLLAPKLQVDPEPESAPPPAHPRRKHADGATKHRSSGKGHKGHGHHPRR